VLSPSCRRRLDRCGKGGASVSVARWGRRQDHQDSQRWRPSAAARLGGADKPFSLAPRNVSSSACSNSAAWQGCDVLNTREQQQRSRNRIATRLWARASFPRPRSGPRPPGFATFLLGHSSDTDEYHSRSQLFASSPPPYRVPGFQVHGAHVWASTTHRDSIPGGDRLRAGCNAFTAWIRERTGGRGGRMAQQCCTTAEPGLLMPIFNNIRSAESSSLVRKFHGSSGERPRHPPAKAGKMPARDGPFQGRIGARRVRLDPTRYVLVQSRPAGQHRGTVGTTLSAYCRERKKMPRQMQRAGMARARRRQLQLAPTASELS
jgi:hypothetical protein